MINKLMLFFERQAFGVCTRISDKLNLQVSEVRLFFIYVSFLTLGSPIIMYVLLMFLFKLKDTLFYKRKRTFDI